MKFQKNMKKIMSALLAGMSVFALTCAPALAASAEKTFDGSKVQRVQIYGNVKTIKVEPSADNSFHVSSTADTFGVKDSTTMLRIGFAGEDAVGTVQIPANAKNVMLDVRATANQEADLTIKGVELRSIQVAGPSTNVTIDDTTVSSVAVSTNTGNVTVKATGLTSSNVRSQSGDVSVTVVPVKTRSAESEVNKNAIKAYSVKGKATIDIK